ncbi:MAG: histidine phosphatase family protein [Porticoccus sp.]|nr:histidine phosphatase family protein [Porticoccus sp.]MBQ0808230.1 histidine phosphatase family protein [Porticoccus sp.]
MVIYLLRHGDAPFDSSCGERSLSVQGEIDTRHVVNQHLNELSQLQLILCSPTLRARQTLKILTETLNYQGELLFEDALRSEGQLNVVEHCVDALDTDQILLLSHQPLIGQILEYLTDKSGIGWSMNTSSLACLETITFGRGCADMKWLTHP